MDTNQKIDYLAADKRKYLRYRIDGDSIPVFDLDRSSNLGQVHDISVGGCLLKSEKASLLDRIYHFSLLVPGQLDQRSVVRCTARSLWSGSAAALAIQDRKPSENFVTGYEFLDISDHGVDTIEALIAMLGRLR